MDHALAGRTLAAQLPGLQRREPGSDHGDADHPGAAVAEDRVVYRPQCECHRQARSQTEPWELTRDELLALPKDGCERHEGSAGEVVCMGRTQVYAQLGILVHRAANREQRQARERDRADEPAREQNVPQAEQRGADEERMSRDAFEPALALLGAGERAVSVDELLYLLKNLVHYARKRQLPSTTPLDDLETAERLTLHLRGLAENGVVRCFDEGPEPVWALVPDQFLTAAYYRNTILHFFVSASIAELSLLHAASVKSDWRHAFEEESMRLRDFLKYEFFFAEKDAFKAELAAELSFHAPDWEERLAKGEADEVVRRFKPFSAHRILRPFVDAWRTVADALLRHEPGVKVEPGPFIEKCLSLGKQYVLQKRVHSEESVSKVLFDTALKLAGNRKLLEPGEGVLERRRAFAEQLKDVVRRLDAVESLAASRRAGLID